MTGGSPSDGEQVRAAEVIAALCLATDLGMGFPSELGLHATLVSMRLCDVLGVDSETASETYYACLLMHSGCTVDAEVSAQIFHGGMTASAYPHMFGSPLQATAGALTAIPIPGAGLPRRAYQLLTSVPKAARFRKPHFTALCEVAEMLAEQLGLPPPVHRLFPLLTERWDGLSNLRRAKGEDVPLPLRITHISRDAVYQRVIGGDDHAVETIRGRGGHAFDPHIVEVFVANAPDILNVEDESESIWDELLAAEPRPWLGLDGKAIGRALAAMGSFSDLASPYLTGHSTRVGQLAAQAARLYGLDDAQVETIQRAGYVHDLGRTAVHPRIWAKEGKLTADEWEQVRLHPYHTERVLFRSSFLAPLGAIGCSHHERLDGSGYHRGIAAAALPSDARLLAAADAYCAKTEPRPYRPAYWPAEAARLITAKAQDGRLDPQAVAVVVEAAGETPAPVARPAGLTERELQVVRLLARGMQTKQVGRALDISAKTADRHIQNAYRKMGVSTRAAATLFAMEKGLVPWGESPVPVTREARQ